MRVWTISSVAVLAAVCASGCAQMRAEPTSNINPNNDITNARAVGVQPAASPVTGPLTIGTAGAYDIESPPEYPLDPAHVEAP